MTVPLALDLARLPAALAGSGAPLLKRLAFLESERVPNLTVYAADPQPTVPLDGAGARLIPRLPGEDDVAILRVLFVAGLPLAQSEALAALARKHRVLVNVEDVLALCDFHVPAIVRRGGLALSVSTGGASPTLSRRLRTYLETLFPADWDSRLGRLATRRDELRSEGAGAKEIIRETDALIDREGWLPPS